MEGTSFKVVTPYMHMLFWILIVSSVLKVFNICKEVESRPIQPSVDIKKFDGFADDTDEWYWLKGNPRIKCKSCPPGTFIKSYCNKTNYNSLCLACPHGRYNSAYGIAIFCSEWSVCTIAFQNKVKEGTHISDTKCECTEGYYLTNKHDAACTKKTNCSAKGLSWRHKGTPLSDAECVEPPSTTTPKLTSSVIGKKHTEDVTTSSTTLNPPVSPTVPPTQEPQHAIFHPGYVALAIFGVLVCIAIGVAVSFGCWMCRKRKQKKVAEKDKSTDPCELKPLNSNNADVLGNPEGEEPCEPEANITTDVGEHTTGSNTIQNRAVAKESNSEDHKASEDQPDTAQLVAKPEQGASIQSPVGVKSYAKISNIRKIRETLERA